MEPIALPVQILQKLGGGYSMMIGTSVKIGGKRLHASRSFAH
jgi:hypothetical protein